MFVCVGPYKCVVCRVRVCECASVRVCECASLRVCEGECVHVCAQVCARGSACAYVYVPVCSLHCFRIQPNNICNDVYIHVQRRLRVFNSPS